MSAEYPYYISPNPSSIPVVPPPIHSTELLATLNEGHVILGFGTVFSHSYYNNNTTIKIAPAHHVPCHPQTEGPLTDQKFPAWEEAIGDWTGHRGRLGTAVPGLASGLWRDLGVVI